MSDSYRTIEEVATATLKREGSRFLAEAAPVPSRDAAEDRIAAVREREHKATHHCSAYRVGRDGNTYRYDDDGEPSGTAGRPILRQIDGRGLTHVLVVVTRYFGGTELGTGGLVRAYGDVTDAVLDRANPVGRVVRTPVQVRFDYDDTAPARQVVERFDATLAKSNYTDVTEWTVAVRASEVDAFVTAFTDALSARGTVLSVGGDEAGA
jgi:uncharacterized YigZ family protein